MFLQGRGEWGEFIWAVNLEVQFPKGPPDGGQQAAGKPGGGSRAGRAGGHQGQKPCLQVSVACCGLELISHGVMKAPSEDHLWEGHFPCPPSGPCAPGLTASSPRGENSRVGPPGRSFGGCGWHAEMEPVNNWRGWGTAP